MPSHLAALLVEIKRTIAVKDEGRGGEGGRERGRERKRGGREREGGRVRRGDEEEREGSKPWTLQWNLTLANQNANLNVANPKSC